MGRVTRNLTIGGLDRFTGLLPSVLSNAISRAVSRIKALAIQLTPVRTGKLAGSVVVEQVGTKIRIRWQEKHASVADKGSPPHIIRPRGNYPLRFPARGRHQELSDGSFKSPRDGFIRAWKVDHPGYPGWKFVSEVKRGAKLILAQELERGLLGAELV